MNRAVDFMPNWLVRIRKDSSRPSASAQSIAPTAALVLGSSMRALASRKGYQPPTA